MDDHIGARRHLGRASGAPTESSSWASFSQNVTSTEPVPSSMLYVAFVSLTSSVWTHAPTRHGVDVGVVNFVTFVIPDALLR